MIEGRREAIRTGEQVELPVLTRSRRINPDAQEQRLSAPRIREPVKATSRAKEK